MSYVAHVRIQKSEATLPVQCEQCEALNVNATRERARGHVRKTGHTVYFVVEHKTRYSPMEVPS